MKKSKVIGLLMATLIGGVLAGGWLGAWLSGHVFARMVFAKPEIDVAFMAGQEAEWLAGLRLNETNNVIEDMENSIDIQMATIAAWDEVAQPDEQTRKARDRFLTSVKVYRENYPGGGPGASRLNALLEAVPGRNPTSACKSAICRLDDLRLSLLRSSTNAP
jgi:hypothetical protein